MEGDDSSTAAVALCSPRRSASSVSVSCSCSWSAVRSTCTSSRRSACDCASAASFSPMNDMLRSTIHACRCCSRCSLRAPTSDGGIGHSESRATAGGGGSTSGSSARSRPGLRTRLATGSSRSGWFPVSGGHVAVRRVSSAHDTSAASCDSSARVSLRRFHSCTSAVRRARLLLAAAVSARPPPADIGDSS
eukprot:4773581-Prymnesium_polylepis.2